MYQAVIQRAIHDACGCTQVAPTPAHQMRDATGAWNFLYSNHKPFIDDRWIVCEWAGVDAEHFEARMRIAAIEHPTAEAMKNAWTNLELVYWRLGGCVGQKPSPRPERIERTGRERGRKVAPRGRSRYIPQVERGRSFGVPRDRRDAGQLRPPLHANRPMHTLLFQPRPQGTPAYPTGSFSSRSSGGAEAVQLMGLAQLALPFKF